MPETLFCYCCRVHHPKEQMRRFSTRAGYRWRCQGSIEAAMRSIDERDAFGRRQTIINRDAAHRSTDFTVRLRCQRRHD